ncbi:MarR family winged helix-turn-helix transcriptional regulator [Brevibacterium sp. HMSC063G07]|uniref:MarR family winged helix-turn-helix transcriptional regulator n=1 Tax=Brevibacterium sp. HMSC063G07 TaxID=1739261 RepID=UPI0008A2F11F|nr:MarR family transcriptional regulator [Brevibacterium sp. HMSC063G07]OFL67569.1 hypothetical protein HMPREF2757_09870 [Brevibacterium sp. HMSC063G07]
MEAAEELRYLILAAQREGNRVLAQGLRPLGLTPSQSEVLRIVQVHQPLTLREVGELLVCDSGQSPSRLVDKLVEKGFIDRAVAENDRRNVVLSLTEAGAGVCEQVIAIENELYTLIDEAIGDSDPRSTTELLRNIVAGTVAEKALSIRTGYSPSDDKN